MGTAAVVLSLLLTNVYFAAAKVNGTHGSQTLMRYEADTRQYATTNDCAISDLLQQSEWMEDYSELIDKPCKEVFAGGTINAGIWEISTIDEEVLAIVKFLNSDLVADTNEVDVSKAAATANLGPKVYGYRLAVAENEQRLMVMEKLNGLEYAQHVRPLGQNPDTPGILADIYCREVYRFWNEVGFAHGDLNGQNEFIFGGANPYMKFIDFGKSKGLKELDAFIKDMNVLWARRCHPDQTSIIGFSKEPLPFNTDQIGANLGDSELLDWAVIQLKQGPKCRIYRWSEGRGKSTFVWTQICPKLA